jgi:hypothetical protein
MHDQSFNNSADERKKGWVAFKLNIFSVFFFQIRSLINSSIHLILDALCAIFEANKYDKISEFMGVTFLYQKLYFFLEVVEYLNFELTKL